jgi:methionine biosynthesis protein MetW
MTEKATMEALARLVPEGSRVLDLGCGDGSMLDYLQRSRGCSGYGIEIADANVLACVRRGVNVIQLNLDEGLAMFGDNSFDVVLQIDTLQHLRNAEVMLRETARVGRTGIVAFPNFAHWPNRLSVLRGRMPVTRRLPYQWYDTPNIRVGTYKDFEVLALKNQLRMIDSFGLQNGRAVRWCPNARAGTAVFHFEQARRHRLHRRAVRARGFERYGADAVTLSPFMGFDSVEPYLRYPGKGAFLLCRTSNPGGDDFQNQRLASVDGQPLLYEHIARLAQGPWNKNGQLGLVVGATYPAEIERVRAIAPQVPAADSRRGRPGR